MTDVCDIMRNKCIEMIKNASPEFLACLAAGVDMETTSVYKSATDTWEIAMKTVRPVGFVRSVHGEITSVVVRSV